MYPLKPRECAAQTDASNAGYVGCASVNVTLKSGAKILHEKEKKKRAEEKKAVKSGLGAAELQFTFSRERAKGGGMRA